MRIKRILAAVLAVMVLTGAALADTVGAGSDADAIRGVQTELTKLSLLTQENVNGEWDDATLRAVLRFQRFVNNVSGEGTVEESGECDDATAEYLAYAAKKGWNVAEQVALEDVHTPEEMEAIAEAEAIAAEEARIAAEEAAAQKLIDDQATIAYVQSMLRHLGLTDEVSGEYSEETKEAIIRAQMYVNETQGEGTLEVNGAYDDPETMAWLNRGVEEEWTVPREGPVVTPAPTEEPALGETDGEGSTEDESSGDKAEATPAPSGPAKIENFVMTVDGEIREGKVELQPGKYTIGWSGENVAMFSMYMYDSDGNLLNKSENVSVNAITLDTFGMTNGAMYEIRVGAVPAGGQVADMEWRSLYLTLK